MEAVFVWARARGGDWEQTEPAHGAPRGFEDKREFYLLRPAALGIADSTL